MSIHVHKISDDFLSGYKSFTANFEKTLGCTR